MNGQEPAQLTPSLSVDLKTFTGTAGSNVDTKNSISVIRNIDKGTAQVIADSRKRELNKRLGNGASGETPKTKMGGQQSLPPLGKRNFVNYDQEWDILCFLHERDTAREEARKAKAELHDALIKIYDMGKTIDELQAKLAGQTGNKSPAKTTRKKRPPAQNTLDIPSRRKATSSPRKSRSRSPALCQSSPNRQSTASPRKSASKKVEREKEDQHDGYIYYRALASRFPSMPLSMALDAEDKFKAADVNNDGTIDRDELDAVLMANNFLLTPEQIDSLLADVDVDKNKTVDLIDVLTVLNELERRKTSPFPPDIQDKKSQICSIQ